MIWISTLSLSLSLYDLLPKKFYYKIQNMDKYKSYTPIIWAYCINNICDITLCHFERQHWIFFKHGTCSIFKFTRQPERQPIFVSSFPRHGKNNESFTTGNPQNKYFHLFQKTKTTILTMLSYFNHCFLKIFLHKFTSLVYTGPLQPLTHR